MGRDIIKIIVAAALSALLGACASTAPGGRSQLVAPNPVSSVYSSIDMNLELATTPTIATACTGAQCRVNQGFERQVKRLGARLTKAAYASDPDLKNRVPAFNFTVAEKSEFGTTSDADGNIVVYRALQTRGVDERVIAFLIAREMGHVIARHHDEKSAATLVASLVVRLLLPATNLVGAAALLAGTAASAAGTKAMANDDDPRKTQEATAIAIDLMSRQGWSPAELRSALARYAKTLPDDDWKQSVKESLAAVEEADMKRELVALHR